MHGRHFRLGTSYYRSVILQKKKRRDGGEAWRAWAVWRPKTAYANWIPPYSINCAAYNTPDFIVTTRPGPGVTCRPLLIIYRACGNWALHNPPPLRRRYHIQSQLLIGQSSKAVSCLCILDFLSRTLCIMHGLSNRRSGASMTTSSVL